LNRATSIRIMTGVTIAIAVLWLARAGHMGMSLRGRNLLSAAISN
jgi:hypothetical protein